MDWSIIITSVISVVVGGIGGKLIDKRRTPYQMTLDLLQEQKKFYAERNAELEREKLDSAEKSAVIRKSGKCEHRFKDPKIVCPVDEADNERLERRCQRCNPNKEDDKE